MCLCPALRAKVIHGRYDAPSEEVMPKTIDYHAGSERIVDANDLIGQIES